MGSLTQVYTSTTGLTREKELKQNTLRAFPPTCTLLQCTSVYIPHPWTSASLFHLTFKLEATQCTKGKGDATHITGLWDVGEAGGGELVGEALRHAWMSQRLVHQNKGEHFQ